MASSKSLKWADKVKIQIKVDDLHLVTYVDDPKYSCVNCHKLALCNYLAECSHVYCAMCQDDVKDQKCVAEGCKQVITKMEEDIETEEVIAGLKAFCPFKDNGCKEEIPLKNYLEHEANCAQSNKEHEAINKQSTKDIRPKVHKKSTTTEIQQETEELKQDNENLKEHEAIYTQSTKDILPKVYKKSTTTEIQEETEELKQDIEDLKDKIRELECQHEELKSRQKVDQTDIKNEHKNLKNMTAMKMKRIDLESESKREELKNSIKELQATIKIFAEELVAFKSQNDQKSKEETHPMDMEKLKEHTHEVMQKCDENIKAVCEKATNNLEKYFKDQTEEMQNFMKDLDWKLGCLVETNDSKFTEYSWEVKGIEQLISDWLSDGIEVCSQTFALRGVGLQCKIELVACNKDVCISCTFQQMGNFVPQQPLFFKQSICILDQSETGAKRHNHRKHFPNFIDKADEEGRYLFNKKTNFFVPIKLFEEERYPYAKGNTVIINFLIEPISFSYNVYFSKNGRLLWKMDHFLEKRQNGIDGINTVLYSEYFYSGEPGYRMVLEARFHNSAIIFGLRFVKGKYDDFLSNHFPHTTTLRILDQSKPSDGNHLTRTCDSEEALFDRFMEMSHKDIANAVYLKEQCILIEVVVEPQKSSN